MRAVVIHCSPAHALVGLPIPPAFEPVPADADELNLAKNPAFDDFVYSLEIRLESALVECLENFSGFARRGNHQVNIGGCKPERLFAKHMFSGPQSGGRVPGVK